MTLLRSMGAGSNLGPVFRLTVEAAGVSLPMCGPVLDQDRGARASIVYLSVLDARERF